MISLRTLSRLVGLVAGGRILPPPAPSGVRLGALGDLGDCHILRPPA